jgi:hypothetical protein
MISKLFLSVAFAIGLSTAAFAGVMMAPVGESSPAITRVAEGCGPGFWRGPHGACHPMAHNRACPRGFHLGPHGQRCWPN